MLTGLVGVGALTDSITSKHCLVVLCRVDDLGSEEDLGSEVELGSESNDENVDEMNATANENEKKVKEIADENVAEMNATASENEKVKKEIAEENVDEMNATASENEKKVKEIAEENVDEMNATASENEVKEIAEENVNEMNATANENEKRVKEIAEEGNTYAARKEVVKRRDLFTKKRLKLTGIASGICIIFYYINTNEIPGNLSRENFISSHVKRSLVLWWYSDSRLSQRRLCQSRRDFRMIFI